MSRADDLCRCQHYREGHTGHGFRDCAAPGCSCSAFVFWKTSVRAKARNVPTGPRGPYKPKIDSYQAFLNRTAASDPPADVATAPKTDAGS